MLSVFCLYFCFCIYLSIIMIKNHKYIIVVLALLAMFATIPAYGQSKRQLENEKTKLEKEIKRLNNELANAKKNTKLNTTQLNALNKKITERTKLIENINGQLSILDEQIVLTKDSITQMRAHVDSLKNEYAKVVTAMYKSHFNLNKYGLVLDNTNYNRTYLRLRSFNDYSAYRKQQASEIASCQEALQITAENLQKQRNEQNSLLIQENRNKALLTKEQQQKQQSLADSKKQEQTINKQISQKEKQRQQLQKQIQKIVNEEIAKARKAEAAKRESARKEAERKAASAGKTNNTTTTQPAKPTTTTATVAESAESKEFSGNKGHLNWPVSYKSVIHEYGKYTHASGGVNMNNGIDLSCTAGSAVCCVFNGKVSRVFTCPNGTKGIIVRHGEYMTVYANMGTVTVNEGAKVSTKQNLGTVYTNSDGSAEFSFQLWKGTSSQNPRTWLR